MTKSIRAAIASLALVPVLAFAPAALAQDGDCYPVPPEGCSSTTTGGDTTGGTTDGGTTDGGDTDGGTTEGPTRVLPTIIDRPAPPAPQPAPEPPTEAAPLQLPRTGADASDWAIVAVLALAGGAGAIALTRRETDAVEIDR